MNGELWYNVEVNNFVCNMILNGCGLVIWLMVCKFARASSLFVACVIFLCFCLNMMSWLFGTRC